MSEIPIPLKGGIVIIDKPRGPSSHQVAAWVRDLLGISSVGHTGTLDPQVSGVLVVLLGKAVRLTEVLHLDDKDYVCLLRLHHDVTDEELQNAVIYFTGKIYQRPPKRSAVKRNLRIREISDLRILDRDGRDVLFFVACDSGTYIRSLCHHIGLYLGTGAHMQELRRIRSGLFPESEAHSLYELQEAVIRAREGDADQIEKMILSIETVTSHLPGIVIKDSAVDALCHGAALAGTGVVSCDDTQMGDTVAMNTTDGRIICIGKTTISSSRYKPGDHGIVARPGIVFMNPGTYPRMWGRTKRDRPDSS